MIGDDDECPESPASERSEFGENVPVKRDQSIGDGKMQIPLPIVEDRSASDSQQRAHLSSPSDSDTGLAPPGLAEDGSDSSQSTAGFSFLLVGQTVLLAIGVLFIWLGFGDPRFGKFPSQDWARDCCWGVLATLPILGCLVLIETRKPRFFQPLDDDIAKIAPILNAFPIWGVLLVSALAGAGEEVLFRWSIQTGISGWLAESFQSLSLLMASVTGLVIASIVFGLCHYMSNAYFVLASIMGAYLGVVLLISESVIVPAVAHGLYDLLAIFWIRRKY